MSQGFIGPQELTLKLVEFAESHPLTVPPPQPLNQPSEDTGSGTKAETDVQENILTECAKAESKSTPPSKSVAVEREFRYGQPSEEPPGAITRFEYIR